MKLNPSSIHVVLGSIQLFFASTSWGDPSSLSKPSGAPPWKVVGRYEHPPIRESSGFFASLQFPGVYWTLNDSGNDPVLYATKLSGELIREFPVDGATNRDWEALATDGQGQLWIGEIGNNSKKRDDLCVYRLAEPDPFKDRKAAVISRYPYRYPDKNHNAEGLFILDGMPHIVSKEPGKAELFRFTALQPDRDHVLEKVGQMAAGTRVTGASLSTDGRRLATCTYDSVWIYHSTGSRRDSIDELIKNRPWTLAHDFKVEANGFEGYDLLLSSERRNIYRLPSWWYERELPLPPQQTLSAFSLPTRAAPEQVEIKSQSYREAGAEIGSGHVLLKAELPGSSISQIVAPPHADRYEISVVLTQGPEFGKVTLQIDGTQIGLPKDCRFMGLAPGSVVEFGTASLKSSQHEFTLRTVGDSGDPGWIGLDSYHMQPASLLCRITWSWGLFKWRNRTRSMHPCRQKRT